MKWFYLYKEQYLYTPGMYRIVFLDGLNGASCEFELTGGATPTYSIVANPAKYAVTAESITIQITNTSQVEGGFGHAYSIQRNVNNTWETVPLDITVDEEAAILLPGKTATETFNLYQNQYEYQPGSYRLVLHDGLGNATVGFTLE